MKRYFVQMMDPTGDVTLSVNTEPQILNFFGFRDCTDCEYTVFDADEFGKAVKIDHIPASSAPFNYHTFVNSETGEVVFEGYSDEH